MDGNMKNKYMILTVTLFVVFLVLKLTGVVAWSWWWVLSPILIPTALAFLVVAGFFVFVGYYANKL